MSDLPQGPGWWRASDGLYYPPEARPGGDETPGEPLGATDEPESMAPVDPDRTEWSADWGTGGGVPGDGIAGAGVAGGGGSGPVDPDGPRDGRDDDEPPRRGWLVPVIALVIIAAIAAAIGVWLLLDQDDDEVDVATDTTETTEPTDTEEPDDTTTTTEDDEVSVFELGVGDCFDTIEVEEGDGLVVTTVELVDCGEPHQAEIFSAETLENPSGDPFPGTEERDASAQSLCEPSFGDFVGVPLAESDLLLLWLAPTEESWADDDREVACAVAAPDGETLTGTAAGAAR